MVQVRLSTKVFFLFVDNVFSFCFYLLFCFVFLFLWYHIVPFWLVYLFSYCWLITSSRGFCDKHISSNVYMASAHSFIAHVLYVEIWSTKKVQRALNNRCKMIAHPLKFHARAAQICGFPHEFEALRVAQFILKIAHISISMEPRGPRACGYTCDYGCWSYACMYVYQTLSPMP